MSLKEKVSAFSVFNSRKTSSLSDVKTATQKMEHKPRSASANTTPDKSATAELKQRKQKADVKRIKKLLKSASKKGSRPSYLPDSALQSPISDFGNGNVRLKALRPHGSLSNVNYNLPLKADSTQPLPVVSPRPRINRRRCNTDGATRKYPFEADSTTLCTPPLPPRNSKDGVRVTTNTDYRVNGNTKNAPPPQKKMRSHNDGMSGLSSSAIKESPASSSTSSYYNSSSSNSSGSLLKKAQPEKRKRVSANHSGVNVRRESEVFQTTMKPNSNVVSPLQRMENASSQSSHNSPNPYMFDSIKEASKLFECLIHPVKPAKFFSELWERKPLLVKRHMPNYNEGWFSTAEMDRILREESVEFTKNVDVVTYASGQRETHNPVGRAYPAIVWDYYQNGCSVRMLNPQSYSRNVWKLLSILQEYFGCFVGANVYLTPPDTQGFAPHYDDIEAFILQLEGRKHWRLYNPKDDSEVLPRYSSKNFSQDDIGEPILDVILEAGDLLYFPRGCIHQGRTLEDTHSLHITVSCMQQNSWGDLLERLVPQALQLAIQEDVEFRKSLPKNYLNTMGVAFSDLDNPSRKSFLHKIQQLMTKLVEHAPVDAACDQMAKKYMTDALPPVITEGEKQCSVHGAGEHWHAQDNCVRGSAELKPDDNIKLIRKGCVRLITEGNELLLYHNLCNSRTWHEKEPQALEISAEAAPAIEYLLHSYPEYVPLEDLPLATMDEKTSLGSLLYDNGIIITQEPVEHFTESESEDEDEEESD